MSTQKDDGGPAFPQYRTEYPECEGGMTLRDWFAGQETLAEWDSPQAAPSRQMCELLAGSPMPEGGWSTNILESFKWEAKWRSALRYIRADAMIAARKESK